MPNSQGAYENFLAKQRSGSPVNMRDLAARLDNEESVLLKFMVDNDLDQLWSLLHKSDAPGTIGRGMSFTPNRNKAEGELGLLLAKKDYATLNDIIVNFRLNRGTRNYTNHPDLLREMENFQTIVVRENGQHGFNIQFA